MHFYLAFFIISSFALVSLGFHLVPNTFRSISRHHANTKQHIIGEGEGSSSTRLYNDIPKKLNNRDKRFVKILEDLTYTRERSSEICVALLEDPLLPTVEAMVRAADKRKAVSISVFRVFKLTEVTQFMVLIEGNSKPQNQAICIAVEVWSIV